ncbi:hypothetical protein TeGR_g5021 [Tetraparma gracilis]|uniref:Uncharacterized protein n=1 Tax=Tetraparma gracilis TaxID=2962635 RepID=A0ABQ6MFF6_9STRA|nr:hypothetical protein TeGR_g5021 [Tetraparma gracilis]
MADSDSDSVSSATPSVEPVIHMSMRVSATKTAAPKTTFEPLIGATFSLNATPLLRPQTAGDAPVKRSDRRRSSSHYYASPEVRRRSSAHFTPGPSAPPPPAMGAAGQQSLASLPIPLNQRDMAALKMGRQLMMDVSEHYDESNLDNSQTVARYFVDRWLKSLNPASSATTITPFSLEMLSRLEAARTLEESQRPQSPGSPSSYRGSPTSGMRDKAGKPGKALVNSACQVLDAIVDEIGGEYPVFAEIRRTLYPAIFMEKSSAQYPVPTSEEHRGERFSTEDRGLPSRHPDFTERKMWCQSDNEKKLADAEAKIEEYELRWNEKDEILAEKDAELEAAVNHAADLQNELDEMKAKMDKSKKEGQMHAMHKASLRSMLDTEKEKHKSTKADSARSLKDTLAAEKKKAAEKVERLQESQKRAVEGLKEAESKYLKCKEDMFAKDEELQALGNQAKELAAEKGTRDAAFAKRLEVVNSEKAEVLNDLENVKQMSQNNRRMYSELIEDHHALQTSYNELLSNQESAAQALSTVMDESQLAALKKELEDQKRDLANERRASVMLRDELTSAKTTAAEWAAAASKNAEAATGARNKAQLDVDQATPSDENVMFIEKHYVDKSVVVELEAKIEELRKELEECQKKSEEKQRQLDSELDRVNKELETQKENEKFFSEKYSETEELLKLSEEQQKESALLRDALEAAKSDLERELIGKINSVEGEIENYRSIIAKLEADNAELQSDLEQERHRIAVESGEPVTNDAASNELISSLQAQVESLTSELSSSSEKKSALEEELSGATAMYESSKERSSKQAVEIGELKRKIAELEEICGKLESTLQRTSSEAGGGKVADMLKQLDGRKKFQAKAKKVLTMVKMGKKNPFGAAMGGFGRGKSALPLSAPVTEETETDGNDLRDRSTSESVASGAKQLLEDEGAMERKKNEEEQLKAEEGRRMEEKERQEREEQERRKKEESEAMRIAEEGMKDKMEAQLKEQLEAETAKIKEEAEKEKEKIRLELELEFKSQAKEEEVEEKETDDAAAGVSAKMKESQEKMDKELEEIRRVQEQMKKEALASVEAAEMAQASAEHANQAKEAAAAELARLQESMAKQANEAHAKDDAREAELLALRDEEDRLKAAVAEAERKAREAADAKREHNELRQKLERELADQAKAAEEANRSREDAEKKARTGGLISKMGMLGKDSHAAAKLKRAEEAAAEKLAEAEGRIEAERKKAAEEIERLKAEAERGKELAVAKAKEGMEKEQAEERAREKERARIGSLDDYGKGLEMGQKIALVKEMLAEIQDLEAMGDNVAFKKKIAELRGKIAKLRKDLEDYGGWKKALYLSGGSVDLNFDIDPWPLKQQVEILKEIKGYLTKTMEAESKEAAAAFREVDDKCIGLKKVVGRGEKTIEKQQGTINSLREEIEELERGIAQQDAAGGGGGGGGAAELNLEAAGAADEITKEMVLDELKQVRRQMFRERLAVNELLGGIDKFNDKVGSLCVSRDSAEMVAMEEAGKRRDEIGALLFKTGAVSQILVHGSEVEARSLLNSERPPPLKHTPDLCSEKNAGKSILPYLVTKKKQVQVLAKFLEKRVLFGDNLTNYKEEVKSLHNLGKIETFAENLNDKLVWHQGRALMIQESLNHILANAKGSEDKATELYHAAKMVNVDVGREEMLNWAATYGESDRLEKAVGLGRKGAVGFASKGEYLGSMARTSSPPRKFEVGTEAARTAYGLPG